MPPKDELLEKKIKEQSKLIRESNLKKFKKSITTIFGNYYKIFDKSLVDELSQEFIDKISSSLIDKLISYHKEEGRGDEAKFDEYFCWDSSYVAYEKAKAASLFAKKKLKLKYSREELAVFSGIPSEEFNRKYNKEKIVAFSRLYIFLLFDALINNENNIDIVPLESIVYWMRNLGKAQLDCSQFIDNYIFKQKLSWKSAFNLDRGMYFYSKTKEKSRDECDKSKLSTLLTWDLADAALNLADVYMKKKKEPLSKSERDIERENNIIKLLYRSEIYLEIYSDFEKAKKYKEKLESKRHILSEDKSKRKFLDYIIDWFLETADKKDIYNTPNAWMISKRAFDLATECKIYPDLSNKRKNLLMFAYKTKLCDYKKDDPRYYLNLANALLDLAEYFEAKERNNMILEIYRDLKSRKDDQRIKDFSGPIGYAQHLMKKHDVYRYSIIDNPKILNGIYPSSSEIAICLINNSALN